MLIEYDAAKRDATLLLRGLDFDDAVAVFNGLSYTAADTRKEYGDARNQTVGLLQGRMVIVIWTRRRDIRRIISMRYANDRERAQYGYLLGGP